MFQGDLSGMIDDAIELNFLPQTVDRESLYKALKVVYDSATLAMKDRLRQEAISKAKFKAVATRYSILRIRITITKIVTIRPLTASSYSL
jgi:hypothetical protein